jgi:uncharacterized membrane protein YkvA (DUF1232 family)
MLRILKAWARRLIRDIHAVYLAARDPRMPWYVRVLAIAVAGYALSPIDLVPDFIPVIGYADDLVIVPLGIWLVVSLIPNEVMVEYRAKAIEAGQRPRSKIAAIVIIAIWVFVTAVLVRIGFAYWGK